MGSLRIRQLGASAVWLACSCWACTSGVVGTSGAPGGASGASGSAGTSDSASHAGAPPAGSFGVRPQGLDCSRPSVGNAPLKRLTRTQYAHAVRDLLGETADVQSMLPSDERLGTFRNNTAAPVGRLDVQQFGEVAELLANDAVTKLDTLVACDRGALGDEACAARFIAAFGLRVARRPLADLEQSAYLQLFKKYGASDFGNGIRLVVQALLESPAFLYVPELGAGSNGDVAPLGQYELATRLSLLLWDSVPDEALLDAASREALDSSEVLRSQASRMLADPRAADTIANFHLQWLGIDGLANVQKDATAFPSFDAKLAADMQAETARFVTQVILKGDGRVETLLTAPYSFPDGGLFELYGVTRPSGYVSDQPFALDPTRRAGLLTQPSFLAAHAHPNQTSPVARGVAVLGNVLCAPPSPPPPNVDTRPPDPSPAATTRERFAEHEKSPACAVCHTRIDSIGFGFEAYDAIGRYRDEESGKSIDSRGSVLGDGDVAGPFDGAVELSQKLARSEQVRECVARQWFQYLFARTSSDADACSFWGSYDAFKASNYDVKALLTAFVTSDAFRFKAGGSP